jgi:hypothetical protein
MMDGFETFKIAHAINMHFNTKYDAFKYHFKTKVNQKTYWGRADKYQLTKIGSRFKTVEEVKGYFASHQLAGNKWSGDMVRDETTYTDYLKRVESLSYNFKQELEELSEYSLDELLVSTTDEYPILINKYLEDTVSIETVCILNALTGFIEDANGKITETILFPDIYNKVTKYQPFLSFNKDKFMKIILDTFK